MLNKKSGWKRTLIDLRVKLEKEKHILQNKSSKWSKIKIKGIKSETKTT
jgi:hypothetical protein